MKDFTELIFRSTGLDCYLKINGKSAYGILANEITSQIGNAYLCQKG